MKKSLGFSWHKCKGFNVEAENKPPNMPDCRYHTTSLSGKFADKELRRKGPQWKGPKIQGWKGRYYFMISFNEVWHTNFSTLPTPSHNSPIMKTKKIHSLQKSKYHKLISSVKTSAHFTFCLTWFSFSQFLQSIM